MSLVLVACLSIGFLHTSAVGQTTAKTVNAIKLANGLQVILIEEPAFPMVSSQLWLHVGSVDDPSGASGTCHVIEHLLAETMKANGGNLARRLIGSGGRYDAFTSDDFTVFIENLPSNQLELALALQAERLKDRNFSAQAVDAAAKQVEHEIESSHSNPDRTLLREVRALRFTRHPYKNLPTGVEEEIKSLNPQIANDFFKKHFVSSNATLVLSGDLKTNQTVKLVQQYLGSIPAGKRTPPDLIPHEPIQTGERRVYLKYGGKKNKLLIAFQAPAATDPSAAATAVLEALLGNSNCGLLHEFAINTKICDSASASYELRKAPGVISIACEAPANVSSTKMLTTIEELCDKIREGSFDDAAFAEARKRALFSFLKNKIGPYKTAFQLGFFDSLEKLDQAESWQRQLEAVSKQDVLRAAASCLVSSKRSVGFMLGQTSASSVQKTASTRTNSSKLVSSCSKPDHQQMHFCRSSVGNMQIAAYDPYLDGSRTDATDEPQDETPDTPAEEPSTGATGSSQIPAPGGSSSTVNAAQPAEKKVAPQVTTEPETTAPPVEAPRVAATATRSNISEFILVNGIRLIVFKADSSPVVRISGAVRAGHVYDPINKPGLSDTTVALMNGGSAKISKENSSRMQAQSGLDRPDQIRFFEGREQISFHTSCLVQDVATQLKLISHHLTEPALDDAALSAARNVVASAIKRRQNTVQDRANRLLLQNLLSDKSQFNPPSPHELLASVLKITADDINQFRGSNVAPSTTTIVLSGNIDPQEANRLVTAALGHWQGKAKTPSLSAQPNRRLVTKVNLPSDDNVKVELALGRLLPTPVSKPEYARLILADCALLKHPLYARLTNSKKMPDLDDSVSIQSILMPMAQQCAWILNLNLSEAKLPGITGAIKQQFKELLTTGLSNAELSEMKRFISGQVCVNRLNDVIHSADSIIDAVSTDREPDYWFNLPAAIDGTTLVEVNQFIKNEFQPDRACVVVAGSKKAIKQVPSFRRSKD
jgi:zinc protease